MATSVVTIARTLGSLGEEIAQTVATDLGYQYIDDAIITRAAEMAGVTPGVVGAAEHPKALIPRLLESLAALKVDSGSSPRPAATRAPQASADYESLIRAAIDEVAAAGKAVIVAHGVAMHLAGNPDVLRILVTGATAVRGARLAAAGSMSREEADQAIQESDQARRLYLHRFYAVTEELPIHYGIVFNTDAVAPAMAAALIAEAARG